MSSVLVTVLNCTADTLKQFTIQLGGYMGRGRPEIGLAKFGGQDGLPNHMIVEDTHTQEVLRIDPLQPDFNGFTYTCLYSVRGKDVLSSLLSLNIAGKYPSHMLYILHVPTSRCCCKTWYRNNSRINHHCHTSMEKKFNHTSLCQINHWNMIVVPCIITHYTIMYISKQNLVV